MSEKKEIPGIRNITVSGRIASGATTLAHHLSSALGWQILDGGKLMRQIHSEIGAGVEETLKRPDHYDTEYEERIKKMLRDESEYIIQSHLAGYDAQGIDGVFKVLVVCQDHSGHDRMEIRIDRLVNRDNVSPDQAKHEVMERDRQNLEKFRKLYANDNPNWVYWDEKYYDLVVNTYEKSPEESFRTVMEALGIK